MSTAVPKLKPMPQSILEKNELDATYPLACPVCSDEYLVRPGMSMRHGINSGIGTCPGCKTFLHLELSDDGLRMDGMEFNAYLATAEVEAS